MSTSDQQKLLLLEHYKQRERPLYLTRSKFKWKWGLPFPFIAVFTQDLECIAIKRGSPKLYFSLKFSEINFAEHRGDFLLLFTQTGELAIELDMSVSNREELYGIVAHINQPSNR